MAHEAIMVSISAAVAAAAGASASQQLGPETALGISAAFGLIGGTLSALIAAGDASVSFRRVLICAMTTAMVAPMAVFTALEFLYEGNHQLIPVVTSSGVAGLVVWPISDKAMRAFGQVSPAAFGRWVLDTLRKILGAR